MFKKQIRIIQAGIWYNILYQQGDIMFSIITKELPVHKNNTRIWIESQKIHETEMASEYKYSYTINKKKRIITIESTKNNDRKITLRKKNNMPVIDINNKEVSDLFSGIEKVTIKIFNEKITIEPLKEAWSKIEQEKNSKARSSLILTSSVVGEH